MQIADIVATREATAQYLRSGNKVYMYYFFDLQKILIPLSSPAAQYFK